ncbi:MAG: thioredoxin family protein [Planctomycetota bacterium]|nr:thioredoxin family protein [Planctomycetota bacterium]
MTGVILMAALQLAATPHQADQFEQAFRTSATTGRPLVLLLGAKWCPGCVAMKNNVLPKIAKAGGMADVEFAYIDIDRNRRLAAKLSKAKTIPQLIRYHRTPEGWKYNMLSGAHKVREVTAFIRTGSIRPLPSKSAATEKQPIRTIRYRTSKNRVQPPNKQLVNQ